MALDIHGPTLHVQIDSADERILSHLPAELGVPAPRCAAILERFYQDPDLRSPEEVAQLRAEIVALRAAWDARARPRVMREKQVHARDPATLARLLDGLLASEPVLAKCTELIAACDEAIAAHTGLTFASD